jgi:hypothetical protein
MADTGGGRALSIIAFASVASVVASACASSKAYVATPPVTVVARLADVELDSLSRGRGLEVLLPSRVAHSGGTTVRLRWRAREGGTGIARAFLVAPDARPCTAGIPAELIDSDGQTRWDRPVGLGREHLVTLSFPEEPRLVAGALVVDVEVSGAHGPECVRLPLAGEGRRYVPATSGVVGLFFGSVIPLRAASTPTFKVEVSPGRWLGPLRLTLGLGIAFGTNRVNFDAGDSGTSGKPAFVMSHVAPELTFFPVVRGSLALGVSMACELAAGSSGAGTMTDPERDESYLAPRIGLILASSLVGPRGAPAHRPLAGVGVELFALRPTSWPGDVGRGPAYAVGLGFAAW